MCWCSTMPRRSPVRRAAAGGTLCWTTAAMRDELQRVLGYPCDPAASGASCTERAADVLRLTALPGGGAAGMSCKGPDDQTV